MVFYINKCEKRIKKMQSDKYADSLIYKLNGLRSFSICQLTGKRALCP